MNAFNFDVSATSEGAVPTVSRWSAPGADKFGIQVTADDSTESFSVVLQGSIGGNDWVDLVTADSKTPIAAYGGMSKTYVVRYVRAMVRTLTGAPGATIRIHVVAK